MNTKIKNNKLSYIILNNQNIFHKITERVKAQHNGCTVFVPHVCNNIDSFGAGFAGQVSSIYPEVKSNYHLLGKHFLKNNLGYSQFVDVYDDKQYGNKIIFVNMIAQNGIRNSTNTRPLNYAALSQCMISIARYINNNTGFLTKNEKIEIHAPKFGSGLAGGNWNFISELIDDIWKKYPVYIYNFNNSNK